MVARWVSVVVGGWLAVSAWLLPEQEPARWIQFTAGCAIFVIAILAMGMVRARRLNTVLGLGAAITPFVLGMHQAVAGLNLLASGIVALGASLIPPVAAPARPGRSATSPARWRRGEPPGAVR